MNLSNDMGLSASRAELVLPLAHLDIILINDVVGAIGSSLMMTLALKLTLPLTLPLTFTLGVDVDANVDVGVWFKLC